MRKFKQTIAIVLSVLMLMSVAVVGANAFESVSVRGTFPGCDWDPGCAMTLDGDTYTYTFTDVPVGNYQFKVVADGQWIGDSSGANFDVAVTEVGDVTINFNAETQEVSYTGGSAVTGLTVEKMQLMGFAGWDFATAPEMTETSAGVYSYTATNVAAGSYSYKFAANGDWAANWGAGEDDEALSGDAFWNSSANFSLFLENAADVTFTLDLTAFDFATKTGATYTVTVDEASTQETTPSESQATDPSESQATDPSESQATDPSDSQSTDPSESTPVETRTIKFTNTIGWETINAYTYSKAAGTVGPEWPGTQMTFEGQNDYTQDVYTVDVAANADFIIFNNGDGAQSADLPLYEGIEGFYYDSESEEFKYYPDDVVIPTEPTDDSGETQPVPEDAAGFYLVGSEEVCGVEWGWENPATSGTAKLTQSNDGSFYYYVAENVVSSAENVDDTGAPRFEFKVVYFDGNNVYWHPSGMGNNTYVTVEENGSTIVFKYVMGTSRPNKESSSEEGVQATVYGPGQEVPVVDDTTAPTTEATEASETTASSETTATASSETTATESSETQAPTQAPATTITVKAAKTTIYVGASTTVKATVTNPVGSTTFKSSNTGVATVTSAGKVVGKKAGSVTITATNNGKSATVKIKVVQRANPMTVKAKKLSLKKGYKTKTFIKAKAFTVRSAKGTVTFKKSKGDKKITVNSKGKVTVKAGLKKGTYKVNVKVTAKGNTTYKSATKTVTLKVVVK